MESLKNKIVLITGASSGIGAACAKAFAALGARLILAARRSERLEELAKTLGVECHLMTLDVRDYAQVTEKLGALPDNWKNIDVLVNNAGLSRGLDKLYEADVQDWDEMIDTNVKGLLYVSRTVVPGMVERGCGHVINIGSIAGHQAYPGGSVYCATKHGVAAITQSLKMDLTGTPVRVSSVDPGMVETEFSLVRFHGDEAKAGNVYKGMTPLTPDDIADAVVYCATRPAHVNVSEMILFPTDQSSATICHRRSE